MVGVGGGLGVRILRGRVVGGWGIFGGWFFSFGKAFVGRSSKGRVFLGYVSWFCFFFWVGLFEVFFSVSGVGRRCLLGSGFVEVVRLGWLGFVCGVGRRFYI